MLSRARLSGKGDIGHHILIDTSGTSHCVADPAVMGNHTPGHNHESLSVVLIGGVDEQGSIDPESFTSEQLQAVALHLAMARKEWGQVDLVRRQDLQRRKGDRKSPITEAHLGAIEAAAALHMETIKPITEVIKLRPPRSKPRVEPPPQELTC